MTVDNVDKLVNKLQRRKFWVWKNKKADEYICIMAGVVNIKKNFVVL